MSRVSGASEHAALEELCRKYWPLVHGHVRRHGYSPEDAQDLTQEFFSRFLSKQWYRQADPSQGDFRWFVMGCANHFLANQWRKAHALKRGGGQCMLPLQENTTPATAAFAPDCSPEMLDERRLLSELLAKAMGRLRAEYVTGGKTLLLGALETYLSDRGRDGEYARVARKLGMSRGAVTTAVCRLRREYRELLRAEICRAAAGTADIRDEVRALLQALG